MSTLIQGLKPPDTPTQYRAVGFLRAQYMPNASNFLSGTLVTSDGEFPADINHALANWLEKNPEQLSQPCIWLVYPRKLNSSPGLAFSLSWLSARPYCYKNRCRALSQLSEYRVLSRGSTRLFLHPGSALEMG